jgi:DNA-binding transcriptional MerR regulator
MKLIKEAKKAGLTVEDVREFLAEQRESTSVAAPLHKTGTNRRDNCWT